MPDLPCVLWSGPQRGGGGVSDAPMLSGAPMEARGSPLHFHLLRGPALGGIGTRPAVGH